MSARIVMVEDTASVARYFRYVLEHEGRYTVVETASGDNLVELARDPTTAMLLLDVSLRSTRYRGRPVDGVALARIVKADPNASDVPIVLTTAHAMAGDRDRLLRDSGADTLVTKPVHSSDYLLAVVADALRRRRPPA